MPTNLSPDPPHPFVALTHALWHSDPSRRRPPPAGYGDGVFDALLVVLAAPENLLGLFRDYLDHRLPGDAEAVTAEARAWLERYWRETAGEAVG